MSGIIFDCDGVLVDSEVIAIEIEIAALGAIGIPMTADDLAARYVGVSAAAQRTAMHEEFGIVLDDDWWEDLRVRSHAALAEHVQPVPGIRAVLEALPRPHALASSSSHERIELSLRTAGLLDLFHASLRFSAADVDRGKPAPDLFLHTARSMGWKPEACVVVEDSPYGVQAGVAAGMQVIGFTGGGHAGPAWEARLGEAGAEVVAGSAEALGSALADAVTDTA
ncbi:HAD family hydrolase [soil metagenome]